MNLKFYTYSYRNLQTLDDKNIDETFIIFRIRTNCYV